MLYFWRESGVQYKGIQTAPYMIRFIRTFMNPIKRVHSDEQIMGHLKSHDVSRVNRLNAQHVYSRKFLAHDTTLHYDTQAVMIGYLDFAGSPRRSGYREFHRAALRSLERDPNGEIAFVAVTNPRVARDHGVTSMPSASLLLWNETLVDIYIHMAQRQDIYISPKPICTPLVCRSRYMYH